MQIFFWRDVRALPKTAAQRVYNYVWQECGRPVGRPHKRKIRKLRRKVAKNIGRASSDWDILVEINRLARRREERVARQGKEQT